MWEFRNWHSASPIPYPDPLSTGMYQELINSRESLVLLQSGAYNSIELYRYSNRVDNHISVLNNLYTSAIFTGDRLYDSVIKFLFE